MSTGAQQTVAGSLGTAMSLMVSPGAKLNALTLHAGKLITLQTLHMFDVSLSRPKDI